MTKKILLADDSITIRKVVGIIFATEDYQLVMTDNGDDAFQMVQSELPDLVIADISMPGKDGFELCQAIKSTPELAGKTSVMLLPGAFDNFDEDKAQEVFADGWLTKPFESQALLDKVAQLLESDPLVMPGVEVQGSDQPVDEGPAAGEEDLTAFATFEDLPGSEEETAEADDIWDSVSFDDDLQDDFTTDQVEEESFAADVFMSDEAGTETIQDFADEDDFATDLSADSDQESLDTFVADDSPFVADTPDPVFSEPAVESDAESLDFSTPAVEEAVVEESDDFAPFSVEGDLSGGPVDAPAETDIDDEVFEEEALELLQEEVAEEGPADILAETPVAEEDLAPVFESEEPEPDELTLESAEPAFAEGEEGVLTLEEDEEAILDLSESDILEEVAEESETPAADEVMDTAFEVSEDVGAEIPAFDEPPAVVEATETVFVEESFDADQFDGDETASREEELVFEEEPSFDPPQAAEEPIFPVDSAGEDVVAEAFETSSDEPPVTAAEISETAEEKSREDAGESEPVSFEPVAVAAAAVDASVLEQQLQALPEDELKEVVARVAGPMIEKMAAEMLEKVIWEVVPDLAEVMIREEIRKIKEEPE